MSQPAWQAQPMTKPMILRALAVAMLGMSAAGAALADPPVIAAVLAGRSDMGWRFDVTLRHGDTGWDHFADEWQVMTPDGTVLATRVLHHPHVQEQPFTRSLAGVPVPDGLRQVIVRARCNRGAYSAPVTVDLSR